jgi:hypothetical protein
VTNLREHQAGQSLAIVLAREAPASSAKTLAQPRV